MLLNTLKVRDSRRLFYQNGAVPEFYLSPSVAVTEIKGKGLGVVAAVRIEESEIIECCPVVVLCPCKQLDTNWRRLHRVMLETVFSDHHFWWDSRYGAMPLGYGCIYNHSADPNAEVLRFIRERKMAFVAKQCIEEGEEITHRYRRVWFEPLDPAVCPRPVASDHR
jgi:SET domain-containing protein